MKAGKTFVYILFITVNLVMGGCATIYRTINGNDTRVTVTSNTPETQIFNSSKKLLGTAPLTLDGSNKKNSVLIAEKEGYEVQTKEIVVKEQAGFAFLDAMLLGIPYIVDISTRAINKPAVKRVEFILKKKWNPKGDKINSILQDISWKISDGTIVGKEDKEPILFKKSFFDSYIYKTALCKEMYNTRYQTSGCDNLMDRDYTPVVKPGSIYITPEIRSLNLDINNKKGKRKCKVEVTWKFSLTSDEFIIHEEKDTVDFTSENINDNKRLILGGLLQSLHRYIDNDDLFDLLLKKIKEGDYSQFSSVISIPEPMVPKFVKNKDLFKHLMEGVVTIELENGGHGSGFFISEDGYILTNYHVVKKQKQVSVRLGQSLTLTGDVIRSNESYDMALIKVSGKGFVPLVLGNSDSLSVGEDVIAIGTPEDVSLGQSVSKGIVSGKRKYEERVFIQTDVSVNHGNSGGPLLNETGEVMGMVSLKLVGVGTEGIGFCIPTNNIMEVLNISYKTAK